MMVTVELVYDRECPNAAEARVNLRRALTSAGLAAKWTEWEATSAATPARHRGYGSPTVLVNGRDVAGAESGDAASCRLYEVSGVRSGAPPTELIARALAASKGKHRPGWRQLLVAPSIGVALVPGLTCPACWPAYAAALSAFGLEFIPTAPYLLPLTVGVLVVALAALAFRAKSRVPFILGLVASAVLVIGKFVLESNPITHVGAGLLAAASLWRLRRQREVTTCSACAPKALAPPRAQ